MFAVHSIPGGLFPIFVKVRKEVDADAEEDDDDDKENGDRDEVETKGDDEKDEDEMEEKQKTPRRNTVYEWEQVNTQKAIWLHAKECAVEEDYNEFYEGI